MLRYVLLLAFLILFPGIHYANESVDSLDKNAPIEFVVVIPSYNNEQWCIGNLESIVKQDYPYFSVYYIDDCSTDKTGHLIDDFVKAHELEKKCKIVHNEKRKGSLCNLYNAINSIEPHKVVLTVDGDDCLAHPQVLNILASAYADKEVWLTYGDFTTNQAGWGSCCTSLPSAVCATRTFRSFTWVFGHLRTFYAKLFHMIKKEDLLWEGDFFPMTGDMAFMFPMAEMASQGHLRYIPNILYLYNVANPINDHRVNPTLLVSLDKYIRSMPPYQALDKLF